MWFRKFYRWVSPRKHFQGATKRCPWTATKRCRCMVAVLMSCEGNTWRCKMMPWQKTWPWALAAFDDEKLSLYRAFLVCCEHALALALAWARPTSNWFQRCIFAYTLYMNLHTYIPVYLPTCIPRYLLTYLPIHTYLRIYIPTYHTPTHLHT